MEKPDFVRYNHTTAVPETPRCHRFSQNVGQSPRSMQAVVRGYSTAAACRSPTKKPVPSPTSSEVCGEKERFSQNVGQSPRSMQAVLRGYSTAAACRSPTKKLVASPTCQSKQTANISCNWAGEIIREYHSTISGKGLEKTLGLFRRGVCRYLVCTEVVGMGLDIPDIERVIQWKLSECLTINCWWQRAGRAGRNPDIWAEATSSSTNYRKIHP